MIINMTRKYTMISDNLIKTLACLLVFAGCKDSGNDTIGCEGLRFGYNCRPSEEVLSYYGDCESELRKSDLHLCVTSELRDDPMYRDPQRYTIEGDAYIESQLSKLTNPNNEYNGEVPIIVEYRTEPCSSIRISLYGADDTYISDVTEDARFSADFAWPNNYNNVIINSSRTVIGVIVDGMTIDEYLENKPMVFAEAFLRFENLDRSMLAEGCYFKTEINLSNGKVLTSNSINRKRQ